MLKDFFKSLFFYYQNCHHLENGRLLYLLYERSKLSSSMALLNEKAPHVLKFLGGWVAEYHYLIRFFYRRAVSPSWTDSIVFGCSSLIQEALFIIALVACMQSKQRRAPLWSIFTRRHACIFRVSPRASILNWENEISRGIFGGFAELDHSRRRQQNFFRWVAIPP